MQISKLGGQVTLQPDTAITHVIYDSGRSASVLTRELGLQTLSELPEGTVCVRWDWVVQCKMAVRSDLYRYFRLMSVGQGFGDHLVAHLPQDSFHSSRFYRSTSTYSHGGHHRSPQRAGN